jgi:hypothetical protein
MDVDVTRGDHAGFAAAALVLGLAAAVAIPGDSWCDLLRALGTSREQLAGDATTNDTVNRARDD